MPQYVMTYLGGNPPATPEEGKQHFAKYQQWLSDLGNAAISPMNPFKITSTLNPDGSVSEGSSIAMSGYTVIQADSMDAALDHARNCPFLDINGTLEVSELMDMSG
jgi:hypothetical protein